jgi:glycosyltransferase involved in cell wall biosynthesis
VSASDNHRREVPAAAQWRTVYPAIDIERIPFRARPGGDYLAFLGRLTANKGAREAIQVAKRAGLPLKIAGNVSGESGGREYFEREVRPHLHGNVEWIGEINDAQKPEFLGNARALLFPIQWEEPFGISLAESFAAGTPVIATRRGATSEQIVEGQTGFICDTIDEMVAATGKIDQLDRAACRQACEQRFSGRVMTAHYLELYRELLGSPLAQ